MQNYVTLFTRTFSITVNVHLHVSNCIEYITEKLCDAPYYLDMWSCTKATKSYYHCCRFFSFKVKLGKRRYWYLPFPNTVTLNDFDSTLQRFYMNFYHVDSIY